MYLSEVIKSVPHDMQNESPDFAGASQVGQDSISSSTLSIEGSFGMGSIPGSGGSLGSNGSGLTSDKVVFSVRGGSVESSWDFSNSVPHDLQNRSDTSATTPHREQNF